MDETGHSYFWDVYGKCEEAGLISVAFAGKWIGQETNLASIKNILQYLIGTPRIIRDVLTV